MKYQIAFLLLLFSNLCLTQELKPGFSKSEYIELLKMNAAQPDTLHPDAIFRPATFDRIYRSPVSGLINRWDLWLSKDKTTIGISLRGTTSDALSWIGNFYAAMIPAIGEIKINDSLTFKYKLAENPDAGVHLGWTYGLGSMAHDIVAKIDSCASAGIKNVFIVGHSQGGALAYLTTSYLRYLQIDGKLNQDIIFKTYASAAPKPGNLYYAYDYEQITFEGWSYNVINPEDWVPETPVSVQTSNDFNTTNPFKQAKPMMKQQKILVRLALKNAYNSMDKSTKKAMKKVQKQLGYRAGKIVQKNRIQYEEPDFKNSMHYTRAGNHIVLKPNAEYYKEFPKDSGGKIFTHHLFEAYLMLAKMLPEKD